MSCSLFFLSCFFLQSQCKLLPFKVFVSSGWGEGSRQQFQQNHFNSFSCSPKPAAGQRVTYLLVHSSKCIQRLLHPTSFPGRSFRQFLASQFHIGNKQFVECRTLFLIIVLRSLQNQTALQHYTMETKT